MNLRAECFEEGRPVTWRECVHRWRAAVKDNRDTWATFENQDGDRVQSELGDRFTPEKWEERYAKLNDLEDGVRNDYGRRTHTVLLSFTASSTDENDNPRSPVDHMLDLEQSKDAVNSALDRVLRGRRWTRLALPEQHKSGYIHWHWAVFVDGPVDPEDFQSVIDSHVRNCPAAEHSAHEILPDDPQKSAVSVRHVGDREDGMNLAAYLTSYTLGDGDEYGHDPLEAPEERQMMLALLWATNKRYWRPADSAQQHMKHTPQTTLDEWELIGISDGQDGELHPVAPESGGVTMFETLPPD